MEEGDNTKIPNGDVPKQEVPNTTFVKSVEATKKLYEDLPEDTARQKIFKALLYTIISLSATLAVPCGSLAYSYGNEKAKRESETRKKRAEAENVRRKLQLDLLKQIIDVAKKAEFKDPKSVYRLGLIAAMVNENYPAFGIRLVEAEKTMKSMSDRLAPIAGLRRRLRESSVLLADLQMRYEEARKQEDILAKRLLEITEELKKPVTTTWRKKKLEKGLAEKENDLDYQKMKRRFYQGRILNEQKIRKYFSTELKRQEAVLKDTLRQTASFQNDLKKKSDEVAKLAIKLRSDKSKEETLDRFKAALAEMEKEHAKAEQTIKRLQAELKSEKVASARVGKALQSYKEKLRACETKRVLRKRNFFKKTTPTRIPQQKTQNFLKQRRALDKLYKK